MPTPPNLPWHSERLLFRKYQVADYEAYAQLVTNVEVMLYITGIPQTKEQAKVRFEKVLQMNEPHPQYGVYFIETLSDGKYIGSGKLTPTEKGEVELGYSFLPEFWGQGFGTEVSLFLIEQAKQIDTTSKLMAMIDPENEASEKILLKSGFSLTETCTYMGLPAAIFHMQLSSS